MWRRRGLDKRRAEENRTNDESNHMPRHARKDSAPRAV
jgi:hypothetical protein